MRPGSSDHPHSLPTNVSLYVHVLSTLTATSTYFLEGSLSRVIIIGSGSAFIFIVSPPVACSFCSRRRAHSARSAPFPGAPAFLPSPGKFPRGRRQRRARSGLRLDTARVSPGLSGGKEFAGPNAVWRGLALRTNFAPWARSLLGRARGSPPRCQVGASAAADPRCGVRARTHGDTLARAHPVGHSLPLSTLTGRKSGPYPPWPPTPPTKLGSLGTVWSVVTSSS